MLNTSSTPRLPWRSGLRVIQVRNGAESEDVITMMRVDRAIYYMNIENFTEDDVCHN